MNHVLHIIRKDRRHLRWTLLAWLVIVATHVFLNVIVPSLELQGLTMAMAARQLISLILLIQLLMLCLIVSRLVHDDPAADREAFWLTRPLAPAQLAVAKLTLAMAVLVVLPLIGEWVTMSMFSVAAYDMWRATPPILLSQIAWVLVFAAVATLTPSMTRYALVLVGAMAAFVLLISAIFTIVLLFEDPTPGAPGPQISNPVPGVVTASFIIATSLLVVLYQYRRRRVKTGAMIGTAGLLLSLFVPNYSPWYSGRLADLDPGQWARDQSRSPATVGSAVPQVSDETSFRGRDSGRKQIAVPLQLSGIPADEFVFGVEVNSQFEVAGTTLRSAQSHMAPVGRGTSGEGVPDLRSSQQGALGNVRWIESGPVDRYEQWPVILTLTDQDFLRYSHTPGRLTAAVDLHLQRSTIAGVMPLTTGAMVTGDTRRIEIVRIDRRLEGCTVTLRDISINPLLRPRILSNEVFVLRNNARAEAVTGDMESFLSGASNPLMPFLFGIAFGGRTSDGNGSDGSGFAVRTGAYRFPSRTSPGSASANPVIDASWLAGAEVVRIKSGYAGHVTRSLTINDFRMAQ